ncbi:MAG: ATP-binding cassette domain-containing protein [Desulfovibrionaceae bacterium]|nr:ATP-binding cassette domain-containing protein [Desulfovibrionaceae bacterium]
MPNECIVLDGVAVRFGERTVFEDADLRIPRGSFTLITGPSGAGKSTLLRLANRLQEPNAGTVSVLGRPLETWSPPELRRRVSYIQQTPVMAQGSVRANLLLPFSFRANGSARPPQDEFLEDMMRRFLLKDVRLSDTASSCSVGQRQRLCLIRALLLRPDALLLDEPTSGLDDASRAVVEAMAEELSVEQGITIVMISHQHFTPKRVAPLVVEVADGHVRTLREAVQ